MCLVGVYTFLDFFGRIEDPTLFVEFYGFLIAPVTILRTSILVLVLYVTFGDRILRNYYVGDRDLSLIHI